MHRQVRQRGDIQNRSFSERLASLGACTEAFQFSSDDNSDDDDDVDSTPSATATASVTAAAATATSHVWRLPHRTTQSNFVNGRIHTDGRTSGVNSIFFGEGQI